MTKRCEKKLLIANKLGLHARAATQLVQLAQTFQSDISLVQGDKTASADSVLGVLMLESYQGKAITVICDGEDAEAASLAVEELVSNKFYESE